MNNENPILGPYRSDQDAVGRAFVLAQTGCKIRDLRAFPKIDPAWLLGDTGLSATLRRRLDKIGKRNWIALVSINGREPQSDINLGTLPSTDEIRFFGVKKVISLKEALAHDAAAIRAWKPQNKQPDPHHTRTGALTDVAEPEFRSVEEFPPVVDHIYSGSYIQEHYGNPQHFLLTRDRLRLTACCFHREKNPRLFDGVIVIGYGVEDFGIDKSRKAKAFVEQGHAIPFFEKQGTNAWKYYGDLRATSFTEDRESVIREAKLAGAEDAKIVLYLERVDTQWRKAENEDNATAGADNPFNGTFNPEFSGKRKPYCLEQSVEAVNKHGSVVNALHTVLFRQFGITAYNTREIDLYLMDSAHRVTHIFEIKTDVATSTLYGAIGQVMLHGATFDPPPVRLLLLPEGLDESLSRKLERIGVAALVYRWRSEGDLDCDLNSVEGLRAVKPL